MQLHEICEVCKNIKAYCYCTEIKEPIKQPISFNEIPDLEAFIKEADILYQSLGLVHAPKDIDILKRAYEKVRGIDKA